MRNVYFNTVGVNYTTYGFAKHSQHTNILNHVLPGGFLCTGTGWPSFLHRLEYGIYSQIACRKARTAGHQGKSWRPWRSEANYLQYFVASRPRLDPGLTPAWLVPGLYLQALGGSTVLVPNVDFVRSDFMLIFDPPLSYASQACGQRPKRAREQRGGVI